MSAKSTSKMTDADAADWAPRNGNSVRYDIEELVGPSLGEGGALGFRRAEWQPYPKDVGLRFSSPKAGLLETEGFAEVVRIGDGLHTVICDYHSTKSSPTTFWEAGTSAGCGWMVANLGESVRFQGEGAKPVRRGGVFCSLIFQPPSTNFRWSLNSGARHRSVSIIFSRKYLERNYSKLLEDQSERLDAWSSGFATELIDFEMPLAAVISASTISLLNVEFSGEFRQRFVASTAEQMLCIALSTFNTGGSDTPDLSARERKAFLAIRASLEYRLSNPPTAEEISAQFGLNRNKLRAGFKLMFGCTVSDYIADRRLMFAHELISKGACSISEVANRLGFAHLSNFTTAFKHKFGYTPSCISRGTATNILPAGIAPGGIPQRDS